MEWIASADWRGCARFPDPVLAVTFREASSSCFSFLVFEINFFIKIYFTIIIISPKFQSTCCWLFSQQNWLVTNVWLLHRNFHNRGDRTHLGQSWFFPHISRPPYANFFFLLRSFFNLALNPFIFLTVLHQNCRSYIDFYFSVFFYRTGVELDRCVYQVRREKRGK
jgi:hypothetical protein